MCTVTFIPDGDTLIFTSNRDEAVSRPLAFAPAIEILNHKTLLFPKDPRAGGTWFCVAEDGTIAVLLNGAFARHIPTGNYRKSRGLVLLDIISNESPLLELQNYNFDQIEPFTLLLYLRDRIETSFTEFRWDGESRYFKNIDSTSPCIYSSATLYDPPIIKQREEWFSEFLKNGQEKTPRSVRDFHHTAGRGDSTNGLVMSRGEFLKTQCITQAVVSRRDIELYHHDLIGDTEDHKTLIISQKV